MEINEGMIILIIGWVGAILILWNLHRHSQAIGKRAFLLASLLTTALLIGGMILVDFRAVSNLLGGRKSVAIFPFVETDSTHAAITPAGLGYADLTASQLQLAGLEKIHVLPVESLFELPDPDSLAKREYILRFGRAAGLSYVGIGSFQVANRESVVDFQLFANDRPEPVVRRRYSAPLNDNLSLVRQICKDILSKCGEEETGSWQMSLPARLAPAQQQEYYRVLFQHLQNQDRQAVGRASVLARRDTAQTLYAHLAARCTFRDLVQRRASRMEWDDSLRVLVPWLRAAVARHPGDVDGFLLLGEAYIYAKRWNEAERALGRARDLDPYRSDIYVNLAQLHPSRLQDLGFDNELELYQHALALNPLNLEAVIRAAEFLIFANRSEEATRLLEKYRRLNPNHLAVLMTLGRIYINQGDMVHILHLFEHVLHIDPNNADAYYNLGIAYYNQKEFDSAIRFFERAIRLADHADARLYLAYIYEQRNDMDQAIRYLRERIELGSGEDDVFAAEARKHLYQILLNRGEIPAHLMPERLDTK